MSDKRVHTSNMRVSYEYIRVTYGKYGNIHIRGGSVAEWLGRRT